MRFSTIAPRPSPHVFYSENAKQEQNGDRQHLITVAKQKKDSPRQPCHGLIENERDEKKEVPVPKTRSVARTTTLMVPEKKEVPKKNVNKIAPKMARKSASSKFSAKK